MSALQNVPLAGSFRSEIKPGISSVNPLAANAPIARQVLRCNDCHLVQYRTLSDLCRRCGHALPRPQAEMDLIAAEVAQSRATVTRSDPDAEFKSVVPGEGMENLSLGGRLHAIRESRQLTQAQLALKARVPRTYVSRIEHGHLLPGLGVAQRLADALGVGLLDLVPNHGGGAGSRASHDGYWNSLERYYRALGEEQRYAVLSKVRTMLGLRHVNPAA